MALRSGPHPAGKPEIASGQRPALCSKHRLATYRRSQIARESMESIRIRTWAVQHLILAALLGAALVAVSVRGAQPQVKEIRIVESAGTVEILPVGAARWLLTQTNQVLRPLDRLRTGPNSRALLRWSDHSTISFGALTEIEILAPRARADQSGLHVLRGVASFFHRDRPGRIPVLTRGAMAGIDGTEFVVEVEPPGGTDRTTISVIDGRVSFSNEVAGLTLTNGQQAVASPGQSPARTAGFVANNLLQWAFYYPAVLDLRELPLAPAEQQVLAASLAAYRSGDLLGALAKYPDGRQPASDSERVYHAALLLSVGQVEATERELIALNAANGDTTPRLTGALRQLIAAVRRDAVKAATAPMLASELLAASYHEQSGATGDDSLKQALQHARQATVLSPEFGFAWARVAELEFSFGRTPAAMAALDKALALAPRNAQALALKGFLLAAQNRTREAAEWFERALASDAALGNAWLGRGLVRIRRGALEGGSEDLLIAAALEPQRAMLRSYLGKALNETGDTKRALHELELSRQLDPADPTAPLYSALIKAEQNRINEAIRDLERSQELNDNRSVYRSSLLLDQDRAVRSVNLANIYRDAGMADVALREAARAVSYDYANYSAHLFLAGSYNELSDPNGVNLRYETPTVSEYLLANLLSPVGAGVLTPAVSQLEYSRLFERERLGVSSSTEYTGNGDWLQGGSQHGRFSDFSYNLEAFYRSASGHRPNNDVEDRQLAFTLRQQITRQDSAYLEIVDREASGGDLFQYYRQAEANSKARFEDEQRPIFRLGLRHEWQPGVQTLLFASSMKDTLKVNNPDSAVYLVGKSGPIIGGARLVGMREDYRSRAEIYSGEIQQIIQTETLQTVAGSRVQSGWFDTRSRLTHPVELAGVFQDTPANQSVDSTIQRVSVYLYQGWTPWKPLHLTVGLSYDALKFPENFRVAPLAGTHETREQLSPKAGLVWSPASNTTIRAAYAQSLSGVSLEQSVQLEPAQIAGFEQNLRSAMPDAITGANAGERIEVYGVSIDHKRPQSGTYLGITAQMLNSRVRRSVGSFDVDADVSDFAYPSTLREHLDFREAALIVSADQLLGNDWVVGMRYRVSHAQLEKDFSQVPSSAAAFNGFVRQDENEGVLHQLKTHLIFNSSCGFFLRTEAVWMLQSHGGYTPDRSADDVWQLNALAGYRFLRRRAEIQAGVVNITDQRYRLSPLTPYEELPRERNFVARLQFAF